MLGVAAIAIAFPGGDDLTSLDIINNFSPGPEYTQVTRDIVATEGSSVLCGDELSSKYFNYSSATSVMTLCDIAVDNCDHFRFDSNTEPGSGSGDAGSSGCLMKFAPAAAGAANYLSKTTCGSLFPPPTFVQPSCVAGMGFTYLHCGAGGGAYVRRFTFALPPFLIEQACDEDEDCVGYIIDNPGQGSTIGLSNLPGDTYVQVATTESSSKSPFPRLDVVDVLSDTIKSVIHAATPLFRSD